MIDLFKNITIEYVAVLVLGISFLITYLLIPKLVSIIRFKNLMDHPGERSSHSEKTPTLGGIAFYLSLVFGLFTIHYLGYDGSSFNILVGVTILFFVGLKDDLMVLSVQTKLGAQIIAVSFALAIPDLWLTSFDGLLGIDQIPVYLGIIISYFIMVFVINSYNLIDGIDGIGALLGINIMVIFAAFFYLAGIHFYFLLAVLSIGFLIPFLRFNISKKNKIFMGDTGSLIVGFLIAVMAIRFLVMNEIEFEHVFVNPKNKFLILAAIVFFPAMDVFRVIVMRLLNKKDPFSPDRCHMHHILIDKGLNHLSASVTMTVCAFLIFSIIYLLNLSQSTLALIIVFLVLSVITFSILMLLDSDKISILYRKKVKAVFPKPVRNLEFSFRKKVIIVMKKLIYKDLS